MEINNLTIGQVKEIAGLAGALGKCKATESAPLRTDASIRIVVLQRGWIAVGKVSQCGDQVTISSASVIRRWGTTNGLGEIAVNGPKAETVLDKCPDIQAHILTLVFQMECNIEKWAKHVGG